MAVYLECEQFQRQQKLADLLRIYYPTEPILFESFQKRENSFRIEVSADDVQISYFLAENEGIKQQKFHFEGSPKRKETWIKQCFYEVLKGLFYPLPWGSFMGVHPTSLIRFSEATDLERKTFLKRSFDIEETRLELTLHCAHYEEAILSAYPEGFSLYINIPFCPSRCHYCSFPTLVSKNNPETRKAYVQALCREIEASDVIFQNKDLATIYFGGGTPACLEVEDFQKIFASLEKSYGLTQSNVEITVELGRPEMLNQALVSCLESLGVQRISINPQTIHNRTLEGIGRRHSIEDFYQAYRLVREKTHLEINVDLIIGLPGETLEDYKQSLAQIIDLAPDNLTVHTLSLKNGSTYRQGKGREVSYEFAFIAEAWKETYEKMQRAGYEPYYLYRQRNMVNPFENVGFTKKGKANRYNILMMSSCHNVLGLGMGATSKFHNPQTGKSETCLNYRNMKDYLENEELKIQDKIKLVQTLNL